MKRILGKTPVSITGKVDDDEIVMHFSDGSSCRWYHEQDCCECVDINDINGDWSDLIGNPLLVADERTEDSENDCGSLTWTFYTFRGLGGSVDVKWLGSSNGYYSESVDFEFTPPEGDKNE